MFRDGIMFRKQKPKSKLDARLRDLEREAEKIQSNIKALNRAVENPDPEALAKLAPRAPVVPQGTEPPRQVQSAPMLEEPPRDDANYAASRNLPGPLAQSNSSYFDRSQEHQSDGRFAHYLRATGFSSERPLRAERSMQRNKAIFMIILVAIVTFIVIKIMRG